MKRTHLDGWHGAVTVPGVERTFTPSATRRVAALFVVAAATVSWVGA